MRTGCSTSSSGVLAPFKEREEAQRKVAEEAEQKDREEAERPARVAERFVLVDQPPGGQPRGGQPRSGELRRPGPDGGAYRIGE